MPQIGSWPASAVHRAMPAKVGAAASASQPAAAASQDFAAREDIEARPYSSWRRHQTPCSLRPIGARSSH